MTKPVTPTRKSELDSLDRKIIAILQEDGRLSTSEATRRIGNTAERTVRSRIACVLQHKHIVISVITDSTSVGGLSVFKCYPGLLY